MSIRKHHWLWLLILPLLAGCRSYGPRFDARQPGAAGENATAGLAVNLGDNAFSSFNSTNEIRPEWLRSPTDFFRVGPGDTLEIEVLGEANSRTTTPVGPDGKIYYSLLPGVFVWGLTLTETKELLEKELAKFIRVKPEVAVALKTVGSKRVWILGSINNPGVYGLTGPTTLLEALSAAGGAAATAGALAGHADLRNSFLVRDGKILKVDFYKLITEGDLTQNIYLQSEDFIHLRSSTSRNVYVLGAVPVPNIVPYSDTLSLAGAIAQSGGTMEYAHVSQVAVVRGTLTEPKVAVVDYKAIYKGLAPDVKLAPGDIVYVPFVPYRKLALFLEGVLRQFVYSVAWNEGYNAAGANFVPSVGAAPPPTPGR